MEVDLEKLRKEWVGFEFDTAEFRVDEERSLEWARACGETDDRFLEPSHPDFQAHPTITAQFVSRRVLPKGFPWFGNGFDAGKSVTVHAPVRPGDRLVGRSQIAEVYEKTGRSGPMLFIVHRMSFRNQRDELVSVVDWRMVQQPGKRGRPPPTARGGEKSS